MRIDAGLILGIFLECIIMIYYANTTFYPKKNYYVSSIIILVGYTILFAVALLGCVLFNMIAFPLINLIIFLRGYKISKINAVFNSCMVTIFSFLGETMIMFLLGLTFNTNDLLNASPEQSMLVTVAGKIIYFLGIIIIKIIAHEKKKLWENSIPVLLSVPIITLISIWAVVGTDVDKLIFVILCFVSIMINILTFSLNEFIISKNNRIKALEQENSRNRFALDEYKYLNRQYEKDRILRHDIKEHIRTAISLIQNNSPEAIQYLKKVEKIHKCTYYMKYSDNSILNILLLQKISECGEQGISIHIKSSNPKFDFMDDMDIVAIFSNLINNAIDACSRSKRKEIFLDLYTGNNVFSVIKIENSSDKEPVAMNGILKTNKKEGYNHGIGIKSIMNSLKKYDGKMNWTYDSNVKIFRTIILINAETNKS